MWKKFLWFQDFVTVFNQSYNCQTSHCLGRNRLPNACLIVLSYLVFDFWKAGPGEVMTVENLYLRYLIHSISRDILYLLMRMRWMRWKMTWLEYRWWRCHLSRPFFETSLWFVSLKSTLLHNVRTGLYVFQLTYA